MCDRTSESLRLDSHNKWSVFWNDKAKQYLRPNSLYAIGESRVSSPYAPSALAYHTLIAAVNTFSLYSL